MSESNYSNGEITPCLRTEPLDYKSPFLPIELILTGKKYFKKNMKMGIRSNNNPLSLFTQLSDIVCLFVCFFVLCPVQQYFS